jgi:hypothetical protein
MAKNITFPNRACPKCGKPIHIKTKEHDCGWTADSSAKASHAGKPQAKQAPTATNGQKPSKAATNGEKLSKMEAVRRVLKDQGKDTMPLDIQSQLNKQYHIKMDTGTISNYKSTIMKERKKPAQLKAPKAWTAKAAPAMTTDEITVSDIEAVKKLVDSMGAEKVKALAKVLAK